ncbi:protein-arginine deiminase family protein [Kribbella qitaiheensis]|uniref:protein-arginine deiminase family protein n=1 Tax=Kribbella qitaiheensis TaxID=1544730 RepID=UPI0016252893|nr:protein-arginine deiminase family protein [Kribbella qitaiheensis]
MLADSNGLAEDEEAARHIDDQVEILLKATGLRRSELVRLPVLFAKNARTGLLRTMLPGLVNGLSLSSRHIAVPDPHGPKVAGRWALGGTSSAPRPSGRSGGTATGALG